MRIVEYPHPALKVPAKPVRWVDKELRLQIGRMFELMYQARGLGLAANQVAIPIRLLVMNMSGKSDQKELERVFINPEITVRKGTQDGDEGCLSFPGLFVKVKRAKQVVVRALDLQGQPIEVTASDLEARAWQHELDHLDGVVFSQRFPPLSKITRASDLKEFEKKFLRMQQRGEIPSSVDIARELEELQHRLAANPPGDDDTLLLA